MTAEERIFAEALDRGSPADRAAYLDAACAADAGLRRAVEQLLAAHARAGGILEAPAAAVDLTASDAGAADPAGERPGATVGPYKLLEQIGAGGMGVVYMAEQRHPVRRRVALKLVKPGMDTRQVIARFEAERQALTLMEHPNIARVLDAGATASGRPYFVMELVHGTEITRFCDEGRLTARERLELFVQVCNAVQHAHQKGIIHRDIKPSNVLVAAQDGKPVAKVIDFGIAKAIGQQLTDATLFTNFAQMVGTPLYMSPEQAAGGADVDTRSDVYGLGVLLYELLTGTTPFDRERLRSAAFDEVRRIIREEEPPRPSTRLSGSASRASVAALCRTEPRRLSDLLRGEVDWMVMKALDKDQGRRYPTAAGFAADVRRYLADEAVEACPPSAVYRARKFVRRNRRGILVAAVVGVVALAGFGAVAGSIGWAARDRATARAAIGREAAAALDEAERHVAEQRWPDALSAVRRAEGLLTGGGDDDLRACAASLRADVELVSRLDEARLVRAGTIQGKFDGAAAERAYARAFAGIGVDVDKRPAVEAASRVTAKLRVKTELVTALDDWANVRLQSNNLAGRINVLAIADAADVDPWRRQVRDAARKGDTDQLIALARSPELGLQPPGGVLLLTRALSGRNFADRLAVFRSGQRRFPSDFWINLELGRMLLADDTTTVLRLDYTGSIAAVGFLRAAQAIRPNSNAVWRTLGSALYGAESLAEADYCFRRALEIDPTDPHSHVNLALVLNRQHKDAEVEGHYRKAIALDPAIAVAHSNLGEHLIEMGDYAGAMEHLKKAIELDPTFPEPHGGIGLVHIRSGDSNDAIEPLRTAVRLKSENPAVFGNLGYALKKAGAHADAKQAYERAIQLFRADAERMPDRYYTRLFFARCLTETGDLDAAAVQLREAIRIRPDAVEPRRLLGSDLCDRMRDYAGAEKLFREVLKLQPGERVNHVNLGNALRNAGRNEQALASYREALRLDPAYGVAYWAAGSVLLDLKRPAEALAVLRRASELLPDNGGVAFKLAIALTANGRPDEALLSHERAAKLDPAHPVYRGAVATSYLSRGRYDEGLAAVREAVRLGADEHERNRLGYALNVAAWVLVTRPDVTTRNPAKALELILVADRLQPGTHANTLGVVYYRLGDLKAAAVALDTSMRNRKGGDSFDWFFLAMIHWRQGDSENARERFDQAVAWMETHQPKDAELLRFRAEAAALLDGKGGEPLR